MSKTILLVRAIAGGHIVTHLFDKAEEAENKFDDCIDFEMNWAEIIYPPDKANNGYLSPWFRWSQEANNGEGKLSSSFDRT